MAKEIMDKVDYMLNQNKHNMKKENTIEYICSDAILILHGIEAKKVSFEDIKNVISNNLISFSTLALYDIGLDKEVDLVSLMDIKNIYYNGCNFTKTTDITISSQLERIIIQNSKFQKLKIKDDKENKKSINLYIHNTTCDDFYLNKCLVNEFSLSEFEVTNKAKISSHFSGKISLNDTTFNKYISFEGSSFDEVFETTDLYFDDYKKVVFEFEKITSFSKEDINNYINNYGKTDEEKLNLASKLQNTFRKFKDIALAHNNKIYAKECEKLELFAYEIYLHIKQKIEFLEAKNKADKITRFKSQLKAWRTLLEQSIIKIYEITSEHHTNFARIINFTLTMVFAFYLIMFCIFNHYYITYFRSIFVDGINPIPYTIYSFLIMILVLMFMFLKNKIYSLLFLLLELVILHYFFITPAYFIYLYIFFIIVGFWIFKIKSVTTIFAINCLVLIALMSFPSYSKNISVTIPNSYSLDNTLNIYTQKNIREALKIASIKNQNKEAIQDDINKALQDIKDGKPYDLYFGTNIVNLSVKNAQNIQDIKQFIKDNKLLMYYTSLESDSKIYNDIIKAIWIDLQLDTIYFIFFIIMILCIYSMQKTFRKNTI